MKKYITMIRKQVISSVILTFFLFSCFSCTADTAAEQSELSVENVSAGPGEMVEVSLIFHKNPGVLGAKLTLQYDEGLTLIGARNGIAFSTLSMTKPGIYTSPCSFTWDGQELQDEDICDGVILTLSFRIEASVSVGSQLGISLSYAANGIVDRNLKAVTPQVRNGTITVISREPNMEAAITSAYWDGNTMTCQIDAAENYEGVSVILAAYAGNMSLQEMIIRSVRLVKGKNTVNITSKAHSENYRVFLLSQTWKPLNASKSVMSSSQIFYKVTFKDWDGTVLSVQQVQPGGTAVPPADPVRSGYLFQNWNGTYSQINSDCTITAQYIENTRPTLSAASVSASAGEKSVTIAVTILHNPGVLGMSLQLNYDDAVLTLKNAANGEAVNGILTLTKPKKMENGCSFIWDGVEIETDDIKDGTILTLSFDISEHAAAGVYPIRLSCIGAVNNDLLPVTLEMVNGNISVS